MDYFTRYTWKKFMHGKFETKFHIKNFINYTFTQFSCKIKIVHIDNGNKFIMSFYYAFLVIIHQRSCVEITQQDFILERENIHLLNVTRSFLFHTNLSILFDIFSLCRATYLINRLCSSTIHKKRSFEVLFIEASNFLQIKYFGCLTFASTLTRHRYKLYPRVNKCIFLGYPNGT